MPATTRIKRSWAIFFASFITILVIFSGCKRSSDTDDPSTKFAKSFGALPYLSNTSHPELSKEYAKLVENRHTPAQLTQKDRHPNQNAAIKLRNLLKKSKVEKILDETEFLLGSDVNEKFEFKYVLFPKIKDMAINYEEKNQLITEAVDLPYCTFDRDYTQGFMDQNQYLFVDRVLAAVRLQQLAAANYLYNTRGGLDVLKEKSEEPKETAINPTLAKTIDCIQTIFTLADRLGRVKQVQPRLSAGWIRKDTFRIIEAVVQDPRCNKETLVRLQAIIQEELSHWPGDAEAWIGERSEGLYKYEAIRAGLLIFVLSDEEKENFNADTLKTLKESESAKIDIDQVYYLQKMRHIINHCRRDFHKRPLLGAKILEELESLKYSSDYPIIAGEILLPGVDNVLLLQMTDLARMRAWSVALSIAIGKKPKENVNPITGKPFWITQDEEKVTVHPLPPDEDTELDSPLDKKAIVFINSQLKHPIVVPKLK